MLLSRTGSVVLLLAGLISQTGWSQVSEDVYVKRQSVVGGRWLKVKSSHPGKPPGYLRIEDAKEP